MEMSSFRIYTVFGLQFDPLALDEMRIVKVVKLELCQFLNLSTCVQSFLLLKVDFFVPRLFKTSLGSMHKLLFKAIFAVSST